VNERVKCEVSIATAIVACRMYVACCSMFLSSGSGASSSAQQVSSEELSREPSFEVWGSHSSAPIKRICQTTNDGRMQGTKSGTKPARIPAGRFGSVGRSRGGIAPGGRAG
jgi:hypothetical protein